MAAIAELRSEFPVPVFHFRVTIDGTEIGFQEVQGIGADIEYEEIKDIANTNQANRTFKRIKYKNLILKKGVFKNGMTDMLRVASIFYNNSNARRNTTVSPVSITIAILGSTSDKTVLRMILEGCVPVKYEYGALNSMESKILVETMEFQYDSMRTEIG